ncbi:MAG: hypothetical protein WD770_09110 [Actinomycetota bacterium]
MDATRTERCERCGNTRPGRQYGFWYGSVRTGSNTAGTITGYKVGGQGAAFICDQCLTDRIRRLRRVATFLPAGMAFLLLAVGIADFVIRSEVDGLIAFSGMALLAGPVLAPVLLWQLRKNPDFSPERTGETYAVAARKKDLRAQGYTTFWNQAGYEAMLDAQPAVAGAESGDYSFVRDVSGSVTGIWLRDASQAQNQSLLMALLTKHGVSPTALLGGLRPVPNHRDGGAFVMFGGARAPGE